MSLPYSDERFLLEKLKQKDKDAYDYLYRHYNYLLFLKAYSIIRDAPAAQDLVQEMFIDFFEHGLHENITVSVSGYLFKLIRNRSYNYVRDTKRKERKLNDFLSNEELLLPDTTIGKDELEERLYTAIAALPKQARTVFTYHYIEKRSHKEIAQLMGISRHTVSSHMEKALKLLRKRLKNSRWRTGY